MAKTIPPHYTLPRGYHLEYKGEGVYAVMFEGLQLGAVALEAAEGFSNAMNPRPDHFRTFCFCTMLLALLVSVYFIGRIDSTRDCIVSLMEIQTSLTEVQQLQDAVRIISTTTSEKGQ